MDDKDALELLQGALNYIKHVGANQTMRGQQHPQQWLVDGLEQLLHAEEAKKAEEQAKLVAAKAVGVNEADLPAPSATVLSEKVQPTPRTDALLMKWRGATSFDEHQDVWDFARQLERELAAAQSTIPEMLPQLLRDIQSNAAIGEPAWSDIERRIGEVQVALASTSAKEGKDD